MATDRFPFYAAAEILDMHFSLKCINSFSAKTSIKMFFKTNNGRKGCDEVVDACKWL